MNHSLTELILIVDRSGSMCHLQSETIDTISNVVRAQAEDAGEILDLTLALFDTTVEIVLDGVRIKDSKKKVLSARNYRPDGCTALHDAVVEVIDSVGQRLKERTEANRPGAIVVAILTDGCENASQFHTLADVAHRIDHQRKNYNWQFMFLGANQDAWATGQAIGLDIEDAQSWESTADGVVALEACLSDGIKMRKDRARGARGSGTA